MNNEKNRNLHNNFNDYHVIHPKLSSDRMNAAYNKITYIIPAFQLGEQVQLKDLDIFLIGYVTTNS